MKPPCSKGGGDYAARRIQEESRLRIEYTNYRKGSLERMSFGTKPPLCDRCLVNPSSMRCLDCSRGGYSLCESCHPLLHSGVSARSHIIERTEASTGGYSRIAPEEREVLVTPACPYCGTRYGGGDEEVRMEKILSTLRNGDIAITVVAWQCPKCRLPVGGDASRYCCVAGNASRWFERDLLEVLDDFDSACEFNTTNKSFWSFCNARSSRAKSTAPPPPENVVLDAMRIYRSLRDEETTGDLGGGSTHLGFNLVECPACKYGTKPLRMNYDGCFKLNQLQSADAAYGPPLTGASPFGGVHFNERTSEVEVTEFAAFKGWYDAKVASSKSKRRKQGGGSRGDGHGGDCGQMRAMREQVSFSSKGKGLRRAGVFASCCPHYVFGSAVDIEKGEGSVYLHYLIRKNMHASGVSALPEVFGPPPAVLARKVEFCFTDVPCRVGPAMNAIDPDAADHASLCLGQLHVHAHKCQMKNAGVLTPNTGNAFGEEIELQWAKVGGVSGSLTYTSSAKWFERLGQVMNKVSSAAIAKTPGLLVAQVRN